MFAIYLLRMNGRITNSVMFLILNEKTGKFRCETRLPYLENTNFKHK